MSPRVVGWDMAAEFSCPRVSVQILKGLEELELTQTARYMDTFNDTSVHWFPRQKLQQLPVETWVFQEEPDYQDCEDLEIIRNKPPEPAGAS